VLWHTIALGAQSPAGSGTGAGGLTSGEALAIGVPLIIFVLGGIAAGITLLVKGSAYMARSAAAQESTATSNGEISATLKAYMASNDARVVDLDRRMFLIEDWRQQEREKERH
jgi:hypothetical protein